MTLRRIILYPFSILYDGITRFRNHLYDIGHKKSFRFEAVIISVGNLNMGGSGKTPMIEYLIRLLLPTYKVATLSRGYGRKTRGLRFASNGDSPESIGDEPFQLFRKFGPDVNVVVGEDRAFAIPHILQHEPTPEIILLDDAFQHRSVDPQVSILLTDFKSPFYKDAVLPAGELREARKGASRSTAVVVTRTPENAKAEVMNDMRDSIQRYAPNAPVFFTGLLYEMPVQFAGKSDLTRDVVLVTGIANSQAIKDHVLSKFNLLRHFEFRDHYRYSTNDIKTIHDFCISDGRQVSILTTEKDMVKLIDPSLSTVMGACPWFFVPIRLSFLDNGSDFDRLLTTRITMIIIKDLQDTKLSG